MARKTTALIALLALSVISLNAQSPNSTNSDAYQVAILAGVETPNGLQDGIGEQAGFISPTAIWGDGTYLYVGDGPALRRIEIATRTVTTVTRLAASGRGDRIGSGALAPFLSGIGGLWGDGVNIYATDVLDTNIRRVNLATGLVDILSGPTAVLFGLVGDGQYLYGGASAQHDIKRIDLSTGTTADFVTPSGPLDPYQCFLGSGCLGYFVPSPTSLSIDGDNIYATGYNTSLRIINRLTGKVTSSPVLPFIPASVWGSNGLVYFTEYRGGGRIGKLTIATGAIDIVYPADGSHGLPGPIWGDGTSLYIIEATHILRLDLTTGVLQQFAGRNPIVSSTDGVGTSARFTNASNVWSDGANLYMVDRASSGSGIDGSIREVNLASAQVTTLSTPPVRAVWGDGTYLYATSYQGSLQLLRIRLSDGTITTLAPLSDPNGGRFITGDSSSIYVSEDNLIERVALDGTALTPISISMPSFGGGAIWSDGVTLFIAGAQKIVRYSIATGNTSDFAYLPALPYSMWSDGQNLYVGEAGSLNVTGVRLLKVALGSGEVESLMRGDTGVPIAIPGYVWGLSGNLYMVSGTAVYALTPTAMPSSLSFGVPDRAVTVNVTSAAQNAAGAVTVGSGAIKLDSDSGSSFGLAIISYWENGIVTSETAVPATAPIQTGRLYASVADSVNTGLAITNPNDQPAVIQSYFTDTTGNSFGSGGFTIAPHGQISRFLNEAPFLIFTPFSPAPTTIEGTFTFVSSVPVSAAAVRISTNERSEFLMTAMPVTDLTRVPSSATTVIPDFAEGGGSSTSVTLVNVTDGPVGGTLEIRSDDGSVVGTTPYSIGPRSSFLYNMSRTASTTQTGSIRVVPSGSAAPPATAILSFQQNGVTVTRTATAAFDPATSVRMYTENASGLQSAVAIANPASHSATVYFQPTDNGGMPISTPYPNVVSVTIPAFGHVSRFISQFFLLDFSLPRTGLLRIWTDSPDGISVAGFRADMNQRGDLLFTDIPVSSESNGGTPTPTYFPIMVEGSGYTTELVVFGNAPRQNTSGAIQYYSQSGAPLAVLLN